MDDVRFETKFCLDWGVSPKFVIRIKSYVLVPEAFVGSHHVIQNGRRSVGEAIYIISYWWSHMEVNHRQISSQMIQLIFYPEMDPIINIWNNFMVKI